MPYKESKLKSKIREIRNSSEPVLDGLTEKMDLVYYEVKKNHFQWLLQQVEKVELYEKALNEIMETAKEEGSPQDWIYYDIANKARC